MGAPARYSMILAALYSGAALMIVPHKSQAQIESHEHNESTSRADSLTPLEETQWPIVYPPLEVVVTPRHLRPDDEDDKENMPQQLIELSDGKTGNLLNFLRHKREHKTDWQADEDFSAAIRILRPEHDIIEQDEYLVEQTDFATIMGRNFLGLDLGQVYTHFGFEADGTKVRPSGHGAISPINPVACLEGGISCRASLTGKD